jgi:hypothetical protein
MLMMRPPGALQVRQHGLHHQHGAEDVGVEDLPDEGRIHRAEGAVGPDAGAVDQDVDAAEALDRGRRDGVDVVGLGDVGAHRDAGGVAAEFRRDLLRSRRV